MPRGGQFSTAVDSVGPAHAEESNLIHLEARGCSDCLVYVQALKGSGIRTKSFDQTVYLYDGIGTATVPVSYRSVNLGVQDKAGETGWNAMTTVALLYRGFKPGDRVSNLESRRSRWAQDCLPNTAAEQFVTFRVKWDRNPKKYKKSDQTWTKYSLRAWAVPQVQGVEGYREAYRGRTANQQNMCGYQP